MNKFISLYHMLYWDILFRKWTFDKLYKQYNKLQDLDPYFEFLYELNKYNKKD
jgi:hypothetical protein